jgi:glutathione S-transferase
MKDAGIDFEDIRYAYDHTWAATSAELKAKRITITGKVPALEYNGTILTQVCRPFQVRVLNQLVILTCFQHIPILRYLARELNDYDGQTNLEKWVVDAVADIYIDWRVSYTRTTS